MHKIVMAAACVLSLTACGAQQDPMATEDYNAEAVMDDMRRSELTMLDLQITHVDASITQLRDSHQRDSAIMQNACDLRYTITERHLELQYELGIEPQVPDPELVYESVCGTHSGMMTPEEFRRRYPDAQ